MNHKPYVTIVSMVVSLLSAIFINPLQAGIGQISLKSSEGAQLSGFQSSWRGIELQDGLTFELTYTYSDSGQRWSRVDLFFEDGQSATISEIGERVSFASSEQEDETGAIISFLSNSYNYESLDQGEQWSLNYSSGSADSEVRLLGSLSEMAGYDSDVEEIQKQAAQLAVESALLEFTDVAAAELEFSSLQILSRSASALRFPNAQYVEEGQDEFGEFVVFSQEGLGELILRGSALYVAEQERWIYVEPVESHQNIDAAATWESGFWAYDFGLESWIWLGSEIFPYYFHQEQGSWKQFDS